MKSGAFLQGKQNFTPTLSVSVRPRWWCAHFRTRTSQHKSRKARIEEKKTRLRNRVVLSSFPFGLGWLGVVNSNTNPSNPTGANHAVCCASSLDVYLKEEKKMRIEKPVESTTKTYPLSQVFFAVVGFLFLKFKTYYENLKRQYKSFGLDKLDASSLSCSCIFLYFINLIYTDCFYA